MENPFKFFSRQTSPGTSVNAPRRAFLARNRTIVNEDTSMQVAAFNRGLIYISSQIAKLPWNIKDQQHKIQNSNLSTLLNLSPNPETNAFLWRMFMVQQAIIHGNSYAEIERNVIGTPIALWPLRSQGMELVRTASGALRYRYSTGSGDKKVDLEPRDIFHVRNFHTKDGLVGQGVAAYGAEVLGIQIAADSMAGGMFHNSGVPSAILSSEGRMSDEAYKRLKDSWTEQHSGKKTGGTAILEEGIKYTAIQMQPDVLQFLESRQFGVLEIARFLGVPPTKLFDVTAATYSNVENANLEVCTDTLDSWCTNLEMEADVKILSNRHGGRYTDIDLYSVFRGDMKTRSDYFKAMISIGAMTPNQARALEGMEPYKEGDEYYIATNNYTPVSRMNEVIDAEITSKTKPTTQTPPKDPAKAELQEAAISFLKK